MAKVRVLEKRTGNAFYVPRGYQIGDNLALTTWGSAAKYKTDEALQVSAHLRGQGLDATCIADSGGQSLEPRVEAAPVVHASVTWRNITPKRVPDGRYLYSWTDFQTDHIENCIGESPDDVIQKLQEIQHPVYQRLRDSLPPEPGTPGAPVFNQPSPRLATPSRVLRPGSATYSLPERRVDTAPARQTIDFEKYVDSLSVSQMREKMRDPAFVAALDALPAKR